MTQNNTLLTAGIELHMQDFADEVRILDRCIFHSAAHLPAVIHIAEEYPEDGILGVRVGQIASFVSGVPTSKSSATNISAFKGTRECYMLWQRGVERKLKSIQFAGYGDAIIRWYWFLSAVSLVRGRVLYHRRFFPHCALRTMKTIRRKHFQLFGENVFKEMRVLSDLCVGRNATAHEMDMLLTQSLVAAAFQNGHLKRKDDISSLLISD